jgi:hypothetical protein
MAILFLIMAAVFALQTVGYLGALIFTLCRPRMRYIEIDGDRLIWNGLIWINPTWDTKLAAARPDIRQVGKDLLGTGRAVGKDGRPTGETTQFKISDRLIEGGLGPLRVALGISPPPEKAAMSSALPRPQVPASAKTAHSHLASAAKTPMSSMFVAYFKHKLEHFADVFRRLLYAYFMPGRLQGIIALGNTESFRHALDDVLVSASLFAVSQPLVAVTVGAAFHETRVDEIIEELSGIAVSLLLPAFVFFILRRATSLSAIAYSSYVHCCAYFITALTIAATIVTAAAPIITFAFEGPAQQWAFSKDVATPSVCAVEISGFDCREDIAFDRTIDGFFRFVLNGDITWHSFAYFTLFALSILISVSAFITHLTILRRIMSIPIYYSFAFYVIYLSGSLVYSMKLSPILFGNY